MFEEMTYEVILDRMLETIPDTMDKREGSIIWDALSPAAIELNNMYIAFDAMLNETFGDTASRDYLIRLARERGLEPYPATAAVLKGEFTPLDLELEIGARFNSDKSSYVITEKITDGVYKLECEEAGEIGNEYLGQIIPIDYIEGLATADITAVLIHGQNEEETEHFRARYMDSFNEKAFAGNRKDYHDKCLAIAGVGSLKIEPVWNGAGTVRLTILNSEFEAASNELITRVKTEFDPNSDGKGDGLAPIGHVVTVRTADVVEVDITINVTFDTGYSWDTHRTLIEDAIKRYLYDLRVSWADEADQIVRTSQIEARVLSVEGIIDVDSCTINGVAANLIIDEYEIPLFGGVSP